ncbi:putative inner membrane protein [Celeribacter baekdonensis B30]|uniref:Putative inner membrane protein n=2 Tax=Rhodobacterales TaxID=204455 RepID=K2JSB0_9RHOB|nr:putative inner membrane protein [Celeribacter baekdonensis B30]
MNLSAKMPAKSEGFTLAENFKDWQNGYNNLADFEKDIAAISSVIVVILESAGSLAELGLFFANDALRQKMIVVVHSQHHLNESFIKFGILKPLEADKEESVLVYEIDSDNIDDVEESEVEDILEEVWGISEKIDKTSLFDTSNHGHSIFLTFQIIDLFTILTKSEIENYLSSLGVHFTKRQLQSALYILTKFKLLKQEKRSSQTFYFVPPEISDRVDLAFRKDGNRRYDSRAIKLEVLEYYRAEGTSNRSFKNRMNLWGRHVEVSP